ncbi:MAG: ribonuclease HII [Thiomicrospira sp.]|uniref:ribonuclease HII n=1 Tax=Thiomicrospira sp. TaxID=935 RepID=UPI0019F36C23|nr:ribonuclease HII [Thiomicrospira sp.]MBE0493229.1 ribonuclease HII [Thiomicrospira sp.]
MQQASLFEASLTTRPGIIRVGVDEVGRGPLVGEVVAAAVILPADCRLQLKDSKKMTHVQRVEMAEKIREVALDYAVIGVCAKTIDDINILQATMLAMRQSVEALTQPFDVVLVDGNRCPELSCDCRAIVKGDALIAEISAASILAKVYRDEQMMQLHAQYPDYGFDRHKGYPTVEHLAAIERYGLIEGYRSSFKPVRQWLEKNQIS